MKSLIIPCCGGKIRDNKPIYLLRHPQGELLAKKCIQGIFPETYDKIYITILKQDVELYDAKNILLNEFKNKNVEVVTLENATSSPAETIYETILRVGINGEFCVKDVDNYVQLENPVEGNYVVGLDLSRWTSPINNLRNKSFLIINEKNILLDIIEKKFKSDLICLGLYSFDDASEFVKTYESINDIYYPIEKIYLSHIISYMIGFSNKIFSYASSVKYDDWSTEKDWKEIQEKYATYFIDIDVVLKNKNEFEESIESLSKLSDRGSLLVGYTVLSEEEIKEIKTTFEKRGIKFLYILSDFYYSEITTVINTKDMLLKSII